MLRRAKGDEDGSGRHVSQDQSAVVPAQSKGMGGMPKGAKPLNTSARRAMVRPR